MQVIKPQALGLSTRPIEFRKRFGLCVSAFLHLPFEQGERGALWAEQSMWTFLAREMVQPMIDEGVSKLTPEFLVHGHAWPPAGQNACAVRARVGGREKTVLVFGDRIWQGDRPGAPAPFRSMPLDWSRAYGGPDVAANPAGRGRQMRDGVVLLPNLELPGDRLRHPGQAIAPAGFGALDPMHPQRVAYRGTYDASYMEQHAPGFAPDTDWRYFNLAPADQWMEAPLAGDEPFSFQHMHPTRPHIEGRLPGLRARVFVGYAMPEGESKVREVPLRLSTLWFFPHAERCIAIYQGLAEIGTDDASDVASLLGAVERLGRVRDDAYYLDAAARRSHPSLGAVYALVDSDLLPEGISTADPAVEEAKAPFAMEGLQGKAQYRRAELDVEMAREKVRAMGQDPDALGIRMKPPQPPRTGEDLPAYLEARLEEARAQQWAAVDDALTALEKGLALAAAKGVPLSELGHRGPPLFNAQLQLAQIQAASKDLHPPLDLPPLLSKLHMLQETHRSGYLQAAHLQSPAHPMPAEDAAALRDEIARGVAAGIRCFFGADFTGADLSGLDLRGVDFRDAWLESVDFRGANLSGARFERAVLAHAKLEGATAIGTDFRKANLGRARLAGAVFDDADFSDAVLMRCGFAGTQARRARFVKANLLETTWGEADWSEADLEGQTFYKLDLQGMRWPGARLPSCNFIECEMAGLDMRAAVLEGTTFVTCRLDGVMLGGAKAAGAVAVKGCSLAKAELGEADLRRFNFGGSELGGARLVRAQLSGANLSGARLRGADLRLAAAQGALLRRADCQGANLSGVDLRGAILQHADLRGCDLRRANLFGADLARVRLDGGTRFDGALLTRARTWPRLTREQQEALP
ncbi:DUF2169 domain-containing protein [Variovorax defluvii]|uniref:DUF2169 domain-containing protein n=1 Tax=Variovorax defluvii TaxID=913761 RepID=A0ABP8I265_9BURK